MIRAVAGNDPDRMRLVVSWPVREALLAYLHLLQESATEHYRTNLLVWAARTAFGGDSKPPEVPKILRY